MPSEISDVADVALMVARALERAAVAYFLGGSVASSIQGEPRATNDIDFVVDLQEASVPALVRELGPDFDVDEAALAEATRTQGSWNVFFLPLVTKIDLFVKGNAPFDEIEFARRRSIEIRPGQSLYVKSPEDSVLRKLRWYLDGGSVSDRQMRDVVEILRVNAGRLDDAHLDRWGTVLGVTAELRMARAAAT